GSPAPSALLRKTVSESNLGKTIRLDADEFIKLEDVRQLHKPIYKTFPTRQSWPQMTISAPMPGLAGTLSPFTPAEEIERLSRKRKMSDPAEHTEEKTPRRENEECDRTKSHQKHAERNRT
ncbi:hypothetical protein BIW11_09295, partial [Tropilaelaps mercedesae]